ncbi:3-hydroxy-9,10-secoandrosta-1,3,5(10)-triene-9,17-dione monooxygenase [Fontimonas thermophila]|uniref:3-hydroxy-9,10-secoandrosta-1,3,5(10)-triene-9,17-dione monooxygenase n=2 Tax=Fontimonas thermophila TaxID=1076937 RepID=A0A1I2KGP6_9GAMM|nr:flavin-dependent monooxygenase [Fontimonas thermophila]SFF64281.1 3-hydroxy-9,10-secoandrosta-1,3,5(10)-triene-9,17-dione monooxygenase [Fontimonas thermophila]
MHTASPKTVSLVSPDVLVQRAREMIPRLKARAAQCEAQRRIPDETIAEMQEAGFFRVLQPKLYGGYEMDPQVFYDIQMALAEGCMSTAWVYGVVGVHNWQIALFDPRAAQDVWGKDTNVRIASTYMPKGQVTPVEGGFRFSGRWGFSSGIDHCDWVFLGGLVFNEGQPPEYRTFLLPRSDFEVIDTWHVMGLKGTGSKDIVVKDAFVPEYRTHKASDGFLGTNPGRETFTSDLYKLPFGQIFVRAVSTAAIGALQGALDTFIDFARVRVGDMGNKTAEQGPAQLAAAQTAVAIDEMKLVLRRNFQVLQEKIRNKQPLDDIPQRLLFRFQAAQVVERCAQHAYQLFSACGGRGIFTDFPLYRYVFDIFAARAHYANNPDQFGRNYGAVMLGRENTDFFI